MISTIDNGLRQIAKLSGRTDAIASDEFSLGHRLADALGWGDGIAHVEPFKDSVGSLNIVRGFLGPQRATIFATNGTSITRTKLSDAALFAYHSSVHWGIIADQDATVIFNSHWIKDQNWFRLREIPWHDISNNIELISALTPEGVASGRLDSLAAQSARPDRVLTPVDDALVDRLDYWRRQALRHGHDGRNLDENLHSLFAQLFVLRAVEDRNLAPGIPSLNSVVIRDSVSVDLLDQLFAQARHDIQTELFAEKSYLQFPDFVLSGIIHDLYTPSQLPLDAQRYDFSWIDADILGRAYEKYLSTVFLPLTPSPQLALFEQPLREIESVNVKKSGGVFYTPDYLVGTLTDRAIHTYLETHSDGSSIPRIADFACGSGSFLVEAVNALLRRLRQRDPERNWARTLIEGQNIVGIDVDPRAVTLSRMNLWIRLTDEPDALPLPSIDKCVVLGDSLGEEVWEDLPDKYDIVLGNPPFIATGNVQPRSELSRRFRTARGRYDYSYLFIELAVSRLRTGGVLGMVVPNRLFRNRDAGLIRGLLANDTDIVCLVDFGTAEVFERTSAYIGAIIACKRDKLAIERSTRIRAVLVSDVSDSRYLGGALINAIGASEVIEDGTITAFDVDRFLGEHPWILLSPSDLQKRIKLEQNATSLGEIADIFQGIRTGANDIFILRLESSDGTVSAVTDGLGHQAIIEDVLLRSVVFGSDIQRYGTLDTDRVLLYPYRNGVVIPELELKERYPLAFAYLGRYRDLLSRRSSITASGLSWYELVRKRDERWLTSWKLLTRDLAPKTSFALDGRGGTFLVGGTAVVPPSTDMILPLLGYLNSTVANEFLVQLTPSFRGSFQKFEPQHLAKLPVPNFIVGLTDDAFEIGHLVTEVIAATAVGQDGKSERAQQQIDVLIERNLEDAE